MCLSRTVPNSFKLATFGTKSWQCIILISLSSPVQFVVEVKKKQKYEGL